MKTFCLVILLIFVSVGLASAQSRGLQNQACSSINNLSLNKGTKSLMLQHCAASVAAGTVYSSSTELKFLALWTSADFGGCGHPNEDFYLESGFQDFSDSDGGSFLGDYVYVQYTDYDCDGNFLREISGWQPLSPGQVTVTPFKTASIVTDVDIECSDGIVRHLNVNLVDAVASGFTGLDKNKNVSKQETFNEASNTVYKYRYTTLPGTLEFDGFSFDLSNAGYIGKWKHVYKHEEF